MVIRILKPMLPLLLLLTSACSEKEPLTEISLNKDSVRLLAAPQSQGTVVVTANTDWHVAIEGSGFTVEPMNGPAGETRLTITATAANSTQNTLSLGSIGIYRSQEKVAARCRIEQAAATAERTLIMYFAGYNNLSRLGYYKRNLLQAARAIREKRMVDAHIVAFIQSADDEAHIIHYRYDEMTDDCASDTLQTIRSRALVATDPATMTELLDRMATLVTAREYGLHVGSHATGWFPPSVATAAYSSRRIGPARIDWEKAPGSLLTRWFGDDRGTHLAIQDMARAIETAQVRFDYLLCDACFMSSIEALYDLRNATRYIVASPSEVMAEGFPYYRIVPALFGPGDLFERLERVCNDYYDYFIREADFASGCIALTDCSQLESLARSMNRIETGPVREVEAEALQTYEGMDVHRFYDLLQYATARSDDSTLQNEFVRQFDRAFPPACRLYTPNFYSAYNDRMNPIHYYSGVTTYAPATEYGPLWQQTAWYAATH